MATMTAQIQVGQAHRYHGGINPTHYLFLSENSRPAWILVSQKSFNDGKEESEIKNDKVTWIPTLERMLEDALVMIAYYILKDSKVCRLVDKYVNSKSKNWVEVYEDIPENIREELYKACRSKDNNYKMVVTVMGGSSLLGQLKVLQLYKMDLEVCTSIYSRNYDPLKEVVDERGSLS